ncbi:unnamed protein product [Arctia plantaginis]|uniref:Lipoprotein n=1 Tax=Arctia plantaginis TaxID=874455 RepID=A0A8S1AW33_ARCPL|nr:unnamed protein product [Arctia plantaginis]
MKKKLLIVFACLLAMASCGHLLMGNVNTNSFVIHQTKVKYGAIPLIRRVKTMYYNGHDIINSIMAYDNDHTKATVSITSGGFGFPFIGLKFESERGKRLNFDVTIYG